MQGHIVSTSFNIKTKTLVKAFCKDCGTPLQSWAEVKAHMGPSMWQIFKKHIEGNNAD